MRYFQLLTLSLLFHFAIILIAIFLAPPPSAPPRKLTLIDLLEEPELPRRPQQPAFNQKQFVRHAPAPDFLLKQEKAREARFASESEQFVLAEQRARETGLTANRPAVAAGPLKQNSENSHPEKLQAQETQHMDGRMNGRIDGKKSHLQSDTSNMRPRQPIDFRPKSALRDLPRELKGGGPTIENDVGKGVDRAADRALSSGSGSAGSASSSAERELTLPMLSARDFGRSTVGEQLPDDIKFGDFTALNTDRHLYYSFYARIEEMIRNRWVTYAKAVMSTQARRTSPGPGANRWTTTLEIVLDREGNFLRAILHESSGLRALDSAPVQAFRDARQIPHPPDEMVGQDGTIRVQYSFNVNVSPSAAGTTGSN